MLTAANGRNCTPAPMQPVVKSSSYHHKKFCGISTFPWIMGIFMGRNLSSPSGTLILDEGESLGELGGIHTSVFTSLAKVI